MNETRITPGLYREVRRCWRWNSEKEKYELVRLGKTCVCGECSFCKAKLNTHILEEEE